MKYEQIIAGNLNRLMTMHGWKDKGRPGRLAKEAKISNRGAAYLVNAERTPRVDTLEKVAKVFGVSIHQLITPNLPDNLLSSSDIPELLKNYAKASPEGREIINMQARREASIEEVGNEGNKSSLRITRPIQ